MTSTVFHRILRHVRSGRRPNYRAYLYYSNLWDRRTFGIRWSTRRQTRNPCNPVAASTLHVLLLSSLINFAPLLLLPTPSPAPLLLLPTPSPGTTPSSSACSLPRRRSLPQRPLVLLRPLMQLLPYTRSLARAAPHSAVRRSRLCLLACTPLLPSTPPVAGCLPLLLPPPAVRCSFLTRSRRGANISKRHSSHPHPYPFYQTKN
ncbi:hypothetical protein DAI22_05g060650 [Oryza sativa Japonica Group]|nr:hypothetical protein DAI22_05g060650 [Oryza sativa Japonica Group]